MLFRFKGQNRFLLVEVRGRRQKVFSAGEVLNGKKRQSLTRMAEAVMRRLKAPLQVDYLEIVGEWSPAALAALASCFCRKSLLSGSQFQIRRFRVL